MVLNCINLSDRSNQGKGLRDLRAGTSEPSASMLRYSDERGVRDEIKWV
jgi:hypothetical protein